MGVVLTLFITENCFVVFQKRLHGDTLLLHVGEFALDVHRPHDGWRKNDSDIEWCHLFTY